MSLLFEALADLLFEGALSPFGRWIKEHENVSAMIAIAVMIAVNVLLIILLN
jgi:hypothetical protein